MPHRLRHALSPYLQQHADNPVDWWPWCPEALALAKQQNRPILLSIGYSACHWCHVMAHESFENDATAAQMNRDFVNIKVDREEHPDLDRLYQTAHQLLSGRPGGWPLTVFLDPQNLIPFFVGTYFPPRARHGLPAFGGLLARIIEAFRADRPALEAQGQVLRERLIALFSGSPGGEGELNHLSCRQAARQQLAASFDDTHGGFGQAPKFPHTTQLEWLLDEWNRPGQAVDRQALDWVLLTLTRMTQGGIFDHLGGGFYRYSVDERWEIPHFEKMLYDNGPLLGLTADAWTISRDPHFRDVATATAWWMIREMQLPTGGFCSSLDADSEGHEGRFYVWDGSEIQQVLGEDYPLFAEAYGLDRRPNFEGLWHLRLQLEAGCLAKAFGLDEDLVVSRLASARQRLFDIREQRIRPGRDDKVLTAWNALAIRGLARAARCLDNPVFGQAAERALDFIRQHLWREGRLAVLWRDGQSAGQGYLDDYALLLEAVLEMLSWRWNSADLQFAEALAAALLEHFEDTRHGGFFFTADDHATPILRTQSFSDDSLPAGNGVAASALLRLGLLLGESRYRDAAERTLRAGSGQMARFPYSHAKLLSALGDFLTPPDLVILRGEPAAMAVWQRTLPPLRHRLVWAIPSDITDLPVTIAPPAPAQGVCATLCREHRCLPPIEDLAILRSLLEPA
ncbi:MAG: thioredoxin domain-containing protein [Pseudomonadota bacterium]